MSEIRTVAPWLRQFLSEHIVTERNLSRNTQASYRDTFILLLPFVSGKVRKPIERLTVEDLAVKRILQFLSDLEDSRGCSVQTRNQRLSAIRAFARFIGSRDPGRLDWYAEVQAITTKKTAPRPVTWMTKNEMEAVLAVPDRKTPRGRMEHALVMFLYNTGARVSEAIHLRVGDLHLSDRMGSQHGFVTIYGKGGKIRQCPLWPQTRHVLDQLARGRVDSDSVFLSQHRKPYTRFGVYRLVKRCSERVPALSGRTITPHVIRHTSACHLLQAGVDINTIRAWLGHVSLNTTNIYVEIDLQMKARAMELCDAEERGPERPWHRDNGIMAFLKRL